MTTRRNPTPPNAAPSVRPTQVHDNRLPVRRQQHVSCLQVTVSQRRLRLVHGAHALADGREQAEHLRLGEMAPSGRPRRQVVVQRTALGVSKESHI